MIRKLLSPPQFENQNDDFRAKFINGFAWILLVLLVVATIPQLIAKTPDFTIIVLPALMGVMVLALYLVRKGRLTASGLIIIVLTWLGITFQASTAEGVKDVIVVAYIAVALLASIIINWRSGGIVILASIVAVWALS